MRLIQRTPTRLDIVHRPGIFLLLGGLAGTGYAVYLFLTVEGWWNWIGTGVCLLASVFCALLASNSNVVVDRALGLLVARHRYFFLGERCSIVPLHEIRAVAINTDALMGNVLAVICVRVGATDLPITMFGSPFPAAVHRHATRIAQFLSVPLVDKERLAIKTPEDHLQDLWGAAVSKAVFDPPPPSNRSIPPRE